MSTIHELEKQGLPDFFLETPTHPSKTPAVYKEYRDFMINVYQQNPAQYLTATACRRNLSGDAVLILRVHDFLEQVGLINFAVQAEVASLFPPPELPDPNETIQRLFKLDPVAAVRPKQVYSNLQTRKYTLTNQSAVLTQPICSMCSNVCQMIFKHSVQRDLVLCQDCMASGRYPDNTAAAEFLQTDLTGDIQDDSAQWTDEETLKLLTALEEFGEENWEKVASAVGKSAEECVLHFLRLPIEDPYLQSQLYATKQGSDAAEGRSPFGNVANPVMSLLVFLREVVSPQVASAAAQAALKTLAESDSLLEKAKGKAGDAMDVDGPNGAASGKGNELATDLRAAAASALAAATLKATLLAEREEQEMHRLTFKVVEAFVKKLELKTKYLDEFEKVLNDERAKIKRAQDALYVDKMQFEKSKKAAMASGAPATPAAPAATPNGHL